MKISYTGKSEEIPQRQRAKLEAKLQKLSKIVEHRGEKEAHVVLTQQRFLHKVEITMNAWDHALVGIATEWRCRSRRARSVRATGKAAAEVAGPLARHQAGARQGSRWGEGQRDLASAASGRSVQPGEESQDQQPLQGGRGRKEGSAQAGVSRQFVGGQQAHDAGRSDA